MLKWVVKLKGDYPKGANSVRDSYSTISDSCSVGCGSVNEQKIAEGLKDSKLCDSSSRPGSAVVCRNNGLSNNIPSDTCSSSTGPANIRHSECYSSSSSQSNREEISSNSFVTSPSWKVLNTSQSSSNWDSMDDSRSTVISQDCDRKSLLEQQIDKEIRLREGAENLLAAACTDRLKVGICEELKIINNNLQILKEELLTFSSVLPREDMKPCCIEAGIPCLTMGLKETKRIDFSISLQDVFTHHYFVNPHHYDQSLKTLTEMREICCNSRSALISADLLFSYYNQLYFVDRRFFPEDSTGPVEFTWYDSLTGMSHHQGTVGFEKGNILFNIAALFSQQAALQMADEAESLQNACDLFSRSAGVLEYLSETFLNAPSIDMWPETVAMFRQLMLSQAQECEMRRILLRDAQVQESHLLRTIQMCAGDIPRYVDLAREARQVMCMYDDTLDKMNDPKISTSIPSFWFSLVECKRQYFKAQSHWFMSLALTSHNKNEEKSSHYFEEAHESVNMKQKEVYSDQLIHDLEGRNILARAHLRQAILANEKSLQVVNQFGRLQNMKNSLRQLHDRSMKMYSLLDEEDNFCEVLLPPSICPRTKKPVGSLQPDFSLYKVEDIFRGLGCLAIFSRRHKWTAPRTVSMARGEAGTSYGFSVRGDCPVIVATVDPGSLAETAGLLAGDFIVCVGDEDVKWLKHENVVNRIQMYGDVLQLTVITPTDKNYIDPSFVPPPVKTLPSPGPLARKGLFQSPSILAPKSLTLQPTKTVSYISDHRVLERSLSSFSWKFGRRMRSQSKEKTLDEPISLNNNICSQSFS